MTNTTESTDVAFEEWVILELMGHRRLAGHLREQEIAGDGFLRLDVYPGDATEPIATQYYRPAAVYCITPTTETLARRIAQRSDPGPVKHWELPPPPKNHLDDDPDQEDLLEDYDG